MIKLMKKTTIHGDAHTSMTAKISCDIVGFHFSSFVLSVSGVKSSISNRCEQQNGILVRSKWASQSDMASFSKLDQVSCCQRPMSILHFLLSMQQHCSIFWLLNIFSFSKVSLCALNNVSKGVILKLLPLMVGVRVRRPDDYNQLGPVLPSNSDKLECAVLTFHFVSVYDYFFCTIATLICFFSKIMFLNHRSSLIIPKVSCTILDS